MHGEPDCNPYEAPLRDAEQFVGTKHGNHSWPIVLVNCVCLLLNLAILAAARSSLADIVVEFGIELSVLSFFAYSIARNWFAFIAIMIGCAIGTTVAYSRLTARRRSFAFIFILIVVCTWVLFTFGFAFGIMQPLYDFSFRLTD